MALRPEEIRLRDDLDVFLEAKSPRLAREWAPGPDPPDLYLTLGAERFAVEVSALVEFVQTDRGKIPEATYNHATDRLREEIEEEALSRGVLRGAYAMWFDGTAFPDPRSDRATVKAAALRYVRGTHDAERAPEVDLLPSEPGIVVICKLCVSETNMVAGEWDGGGGWGGEIIALAENALHAKLEEKRGKLRDVPEPRILLLENRLGVAIDPGAFGAFKPKEEDATFFDGIFVRFPVTGVVVPVYAAVSLRRVLDA